MKDRMIQGSLAAKKVKMLQLQEAIDESEKRYSSDHDDQDIDKMTSQQRERAEIVKKKQADLYLWYTSALKQNRIKKNTLIETLMDKSYHNKRQRQLARLCAQYDIIPDKE